MNIGIRQILLLKRCIESKRVAITDAKEIFNISNPRSLYSNTRKRPMVELEKLEAYGLLEKVEDSPAIFVITIKGAEKVEEWRQKQC